MDKDLVSAEHWKTLDGVVQLYLEGNSIPSIAKKMGMLVRDVEANIQEWAVYVRGNKNIQQRARESVHIADAHFNKIIRELWEVVEEAAEGGNLAAKNVALKTLADTEVKRTQMLEKAGNSDAEAMAELLLENEKKIEVIYKLLKELAGDCAHCRPIILSELRKFADPQEPIVIKYEDNE